MKNINLVSHLREYAQSLGLTLFGVTPAQPSRHLDAYLRWVDAGLHGEMTYLARDDRLVRRRDLAEILPNVRSLVLVGLNYAPPSSPPAWADGPTRGRISNYAWGTDYHDVMLAQLEALGEKLTRLGGRPSTWRAYVDTGAILERAHAADAGLGFIGKNTMLINPQYGSYFFLGEVITDLELPPTPHPQIPDCGSCTRCMEACPTNAIIQPYILDARRCISYLTIELKGWIPRELRSMVGRWVYGCDVCQQVCPWQRFAKPTQEGSFRLTDINRAAPPLASLLVMENAAFSERYKGTAIHRIGRDQLVRNACVASGNAALPRLANHLARLLHDPSPLVRGHAAWALGQLGKDRAALRDALSAEMDEATRHEIQTALLS